MELQDLYQELIIEHGTQPRNFNKLNDPTTEAEGFNPLCGDQICVYLKTDHTRIENASFTGKGCAISVASASLMTEAIRGKSISEVNDLIQTFKHLLTHAEKEEAPALGKLAAFSGVKAYPARVKCATLAWHALQAAIEKNPLETP